MSTSEGMVCSEKELGISDSHEGILVLPADAPLGMPLAEYLGDAIFDLEVTPNRPDCLSVLGMAREVAALTNRRCGFPHPPTMRWGRTIDKHVSVEIADPDLCPRYCASLIDGVKIGPSPAWMQERLIACGMRPINNIVDITNYVMLEYGQPLHSFDFRKIGGAKIVVRRARTGEKLTSLDGVDRELRPDMLVIADQAIPVAIAGVMGGADSEVDRSHHFGPSGVGQFQPGQHSPDVVRTEAAQRGVDAVRERHQPGVDGACPEKGDSAHAADRWGPSCQRPR